MKAALRNGVQKISQRPIVTALISFQIMFLVMTVYQLIKDQILERNVPLHSHLPTIVFTSLFCMLLTWFVSKSAKEFYEQYQSVEDRNEIYQASMTAFLHYLGNSLTTFQLLELEVEMNGKVSEDTLNVIRKNIEATKFAMKDLSKIENPTAAKINDFIRNDLKKSNTAGRQSPIHT